MTGCFFYMWCLCWVCLLGLSRPNFSGEDFHHQFISWVSFTGSCCLGTSMWHLELVLSTFKGMFVLVLRSPILSLLLPVFASDFVADHTSCSALPVFCARAHRVCLHHTILAAFGSTWFNLESGIFSAYLLH